MVKTMPEENKDGLIHLTIDDIPVAVPPGTLVWAAARQLGIEIPIYCYHPKMPPLGACRMCFVEIEKMPKPPQTACTTPVSEGMIVHTKTDKVIKARKGTLEFLLINHPLDCPICDKGGECDLQDFTLRHGPGGTLTASAYRFKSRPWELKRIPSVCNNCSVGCNARIDVRVDKVMRLVSRTNDAIDDGCLCDRGRWGFEFVNSPQRLRTPLFRQKGQLQPATWDEALYMLASRLRTIAEKQGAA